MSELPEHATYTIEFAVSSNRRKSFEIHVTAPTINAAIEAACQKHKNARSGRIERVERHFSTYVAGGDSE
jgi:hypothetical protein